MSRRTIRLTLVVLLLLMIVAQLTLTLSGHSTLSLHRLVLFGRSGSETLIRVKALQV